VDADNVGKQLQAAGYNTAYCGKWHMDGQQERPGFDFVASFVGQGKYVDCPILLNGQRTPTKGWIDDVTTGYAVEFLEKHSRDKPFFLWLGFKSPHGPRGGENLPERARHLYEGEASRPTPNMDVRPIFQDKEPDARQFAQWQAERSARGDRAYMRHITAIDHCIGEVLDALDRTGQADNTMVIITSDNGYYLGEHSLSDKRSAYEESIRVPLLIRMPGNSAAVGATNDHLVLNIDHPSTILDFAGAEPLPAAQGRSLRPLLAGGANPQWRTAFLYEYFKEPQYVSPTVLALRTATQKLIAYPGHDEWTEVFDLTSDPYETTNLAHDQKLAGALRQQFEAELKAVEFKTPEIPKSSKKPNANRPKGKGKRNRAKA
jgi:arylsulfatase A-like enzyme